VLRRNSFSYLGKGEAMSGTEEFDAKLGAVNLDEIIILLVNSDDGPHWTYEQARGVELWYRRFHRVLYLSDYRAVVPTKRVDEFWHYHILDTRKYHEDCYNMHGRFVHHFPYLGMKGEDDVKRLGLEYNRTRLLFLEAFGEDPGLVEKLFSGTDKEVAALCGDCGSDDIEFSRLTVSEINCKIANMSDRNVASLEVR